MESYNQSFNESSLSNGTNTEEIIPEFATYFNMVIILMAAIIVITPAVMIFNVIIIMVD